MVETTQGILDFESSLKVGDEVQARWTNCGNVYRARARVAKVNGGSIRIALVEPPAGYPVGQSFPIQRWGDRKWTENNRVAPMPAADSTTTAKDL